MCHFKELFLLSVLFILFIDSEGFFLVHNYRCDQVCIKLYNNTYEEHVSIATLIFFYFEGMGVGGWRCILSTDIFSIAETENS